MPEATLILCALEQIRNESVVISRELKIVINILSGANDN
jgi:hypothetical protein